MSFPIEDANGVKRNVRTRTVNGVDQEQVELVGPDGNAIALPLTDAELRASPLSVGGSATPSDAFANPTDAQKVAALGMVWNGSTWERELGSTQGTLIASAARTATVASPVITKRFLVLWLNLTSLTTTSVSLYLYGPAPGGAGDIRWDTTSNNSQPVVTAPGLFAFGVGPGLTSSSGTGNITAGGTNQWQRMWNVPTPRQFYCSIVPADGAGFTASLDYALLR